MCVYIYIFIYGLKCMCGIKIGSLLYGRGARIITIIRDYNVRDSASRPVGGNWIPKRHAAITSILSIYTRKLANI